MIAAPCRKSRDTCPPINSVISKPDDAEQIEEQDDEQDESDPAATIAVIVPLVAEVIPPTAADDQQQHDNEKDEHGWFLSELVERRSSFDLREQDGLQLKSSMTFVASDIRPSPSPARLSCISIIVNG